MSESLLSDVFQALNLAVFQRDARGRLRLAGRAPNWLPALWAEAAAAGGELRAGASPFLENFLVDAAACWAAGGSRRASSGLWVEQDARGVEHHLQASAFTAARRASLVVEELGPAYEERKLIVQTAHEAALAYENLQRAEHALAEEKRLLERRVRERTAELSKANAALREEVVARRRYAERLQGMRDIDKAILGAQSPEAIAEVALRRLHRLLPCDRAGVVELDAETERGVVLARTLRGKTARANGWLLTHEQLEKARVLKSGVLHRVTRCPNLFGVPARAPRRARIWPLILDVPLKAGDTLIGVLNLAADSAAAFTPEHEEIALEIAAQLAVAIRQARLFAQVKAGREQLRALSLRLVEVQEAERHFIAHELHDEIGQELTGLKLTLEMAGDDSAGRRDPGVGEAIQMVNELMKRVRQLSLDLRPLLLDDLGLLHALDWLFKRHQKQTGLRVIFKRTAWRKRLPAQLETAVFRIVQEALTNVARHAEVKEATVRLWLQGGKVGVQIEDRGKGFDAKRTLAARASSGVAGMRERTELLGGQFTLDSKLGKGTRLTIDLPVPMLASCPTRLKRTRA